MSEWKEYKLGDLTVDGKGHYGIAASAVEYNPNSYTYLRITDINDDGTLNKNGLKSVEEKDAEKYLLQPNDIVFARTGASVGRSYFYDGRDGELVYAGFLIKYCIDPQKVNPKILKYYTHSQAYYDWITAVDNGATRGNINAQTFAAMPISLPERKVQDGIAAILSSFDDKIGLLQRENATLEQMAETLFRQWFVEEAKEDWKEKPLSSYGKIVCGKTPPKKESRYFGGETPFIKIPDMHNKTFVLYSEDSLTKEGVLYQKDKTLPPFSVIVSCIATVGLVVMNAKEAQTNQQINSIVPYKEEYRYFLYLQLKNMYDDLNAMASGGTATLNLNTRNFSNIKIAYPTDDILYAFHNQVSVLFEKIYSNQKQIQTLIQTRDGLLPKLMSNKIKL